jgi:hypothetical protein
MGRKTTFPTLNHKSPFCLSRMIHDNIQSGWAVCHKFEKNAPVACVCYVCVSWYVWQNDRSFLPPPPSPPSPPPSPPSSRGQLINAVGLQRSSSLPFPSCLYILRVAVAKRLNFRLLKPKGTGKKLCTVYAVIFSYLFFIRLGTFLLSSLWLPY